MDRSEQLRLWFNSLPIEQRAEILGIDISGYDDEDSEIDIVAVGLRHEDNMMINSERFWDNIDEDLPLI